MCWVINCLESFNPTPKMKVSDNYWRTITTEGPEATAIIWLEYIGLRTVKVFTLDPWSGTKAIRSISTFVYKITSKKEGKDHESIQSSTTPDPERHMGKWQKHNKTSHTGEPRGQPFPSRPQGYIQYTDMTIRQKYKFKYDTYFYYTTRSEVEQCTLRAKVFS